MTKHYLSIQAKNVKGLFRNVTIKALATLENVNVWTDILEKTVSQEVSGYFYITQILCNLSTISVPATTTTTTTTTPDPLACPNGIPGRFNPDANCITSWVGDSLCDDDNNIPDCCYDGNDCCLPGPPVGECTVSFLKSNL